MCVCVEGGEICTLDEECGEEIHVCVCVWRGERYVHQMRSVGKRYMCVEESRALVEYSQFAYSCFAYSHFAYF